MTATPTATPTIRILGICGSLQAASSNLTLLEQAITLAPEGTLVCLSDKLRELPLFNPDLESPTPPEPVLRWREAIDAHDALLIACPEYGHSLPGPLKNGLDWLIGSGELDRKVIAITASTNFAERGRMGLAALHGVLVAVNARILGGEPIVRGPEAEDALRKLLEQIADETRVKIQV